MLREPLLGIADAAGGVWPERARAAAHHLSAPDVKSETRGVLLLSDVRAIFDSPRLQTIRSADLLMKLVAITEHPWGDLDGQDGKEISDRYLAGRLREFEVEPKKIRFGDVTRQGYDRADLEDAWDRYLPHLDNGSDVQHRFLIVPVLRQKGLLAERGGWNCHFSLLLVSH